MPTIPLVGDVLVFESAIYLAGLRVRQSGSFAFDLPLFRHLLLQIVHSQAFLQMITFFEVVHHFFECALFFSLIAILYKRYLTSILISEMRSHSYNASLRCISFNKCAPTRSNHQQPRYSQRLHLGSGFLILLCGGNRDSARKETRVSAVG